jgi:hypothetical protein
VVCKCTAEADEEAVTLFNDEVEACVDVGSLSGDLETEEDWECLAVLVCFRTDRVLSFSVRGAFSDGCAMLVTFGFDPVGVLCGLEVLVLDSAGVDKSSGAERHLFNKRLWGTSLCLSADTMSFLTSSMIYRGRDSRGPATALFGTPSMIAETAVVLLSGRSRAMRKSSSLAGAFKTVSISSSKPSIILKESCGLSTSSSASVSFLITLTDRKKGVSSAEHCLSSSCRPLFAATWKVSVFGRKRVTGVGREDGIRVKGTTDEVTEGNEDVKLMLVPSDGEGSKAVPKTNLCHMLRPPALAERGILTLPLRGDVTERVVKV